MPKKNDPNFRKDKPSPASSGNRNQRSYQTGTPKSQVGGFRMGGHCICPKCRVTVKYQRGVPCNKIKCPSCNGPMASQK